MRFVDIRQVVSVQWPQSSFDKRMTTAADALG